MLAVTRRVILGDDRVRRVRLTSLGAVPRALVVAGLAILGLIVVLMLYDDWVPRAGLTLEGYGSTYSVWVLPIVLVAAGVAATALTLAAARSSVPSRVVRSVSCLALLLGALSQLPDVPARAGWLVAAVALLALALLAPLPEPVRAACVLAPYVVVAALVGRADGLEAGLAALGQGQAVIGVGGLLAVAVTLSLMSSLEERHRRTQRALTWRPSLRLVALVAMAKVGLLILLYLGVLGDALGGETFWSPRTGAPLSWVHAGLVATLALALAFRSAKRPLPERALRGRTQALALAPALPFLALLLGLLVVMAADTVDPLANPTWGLDAGTWVIENLDTLWLAAAVAVLLVAAAERLLRHPLSSGSALWLVAGVWLVPPQLGGWLLARGHDVPTFWSTPGQVDTALTVGVLVLLPLGAVGRTRILLRALVVPTVLLVGGSLLPDAWSARLWLVLLLAAVFASLVLRAPPVSGDRRRYEREVLVVVAGNVLLLAGYFMVPTDAGLVDSLGSASLLALLWVVVPVTCVLLADTRTEPDAEHVRTPVWQRRLRVRLARMTRPHRRGPTLATRVE